MTSQDAYNSLKLFRKLLISSMQSRSSNSRLSKFLKSKRNLWSKTSRSLHKTNSLILIGNWRVSKLANDAWIKNFSNILSKRVSSIYLMIYSLMRNLKLPKIKTAIRQIKRERLLKWIQIRVKNKMIRVRFKRTKRNEKRKRKQRSKTM